MLPSHGSYSLRDIRLEDRNQDHLPAFTYSVMTASWPEGNPHTLHHMEDAEPSLDCIPKQERGI